MDKKLLNKRLNNLEKKIDRLNENLDRISILLEKQILEKNERLAIYRSFNNKTEEAKGELTSFEKYIAENLSTISHKTWYGSSEIVETDTEVTIKAQNDFCKEVLEKRYSDIHERYNKKVTII